MLEKFLRIKKGIVIPAAFLIVAALLVLLIFGISGGLLSILLGEQQLEWQGKSWAYKASSNAGVAAGTDSVSLQAGCQHTGCSAYFRSDFDIGKYSEVRLLIDAATKAYTVSNSASGSGSASVVLGGQNVITVSSSAEERGGTNIPSDADSLTQKLIILKKEGLGWGVYTDEVKILTVTGESPELRFTVSGGGNYGGGSGTMTVFAGFKTVVEPPVIPQASLFSTVFVKVQEWFKRFFEVIGLEISGPQSFTLPDAGVGLAADSLVSYSVNLKAPLAVDTDFEDGNYAVRYCSAGFVRKDGSIFNSTSPERCFDEWNKNLAFTVPLRVDQFAVVAVMTENVGTYDSSKGVWVWSGEQVLVKEFLNVKTKAPMPSPPQPGFFASLIQSFLDFFKKLFA